MVGQHWHTHVAGLVKSSPTAAAAAAANAVVAGLAAAASAGIVPARPTDRRSVQDRLTHSLAVHVEDDRKEASEIGVAVLRVLLGLG